MKRWEERISDLENAIFRLNEAIEDSRNYSIESLKDAVIQRFEFSLELSWKAMKNYLNYQGILEATTPKQTIKEAFANGLIKNGETWINMLNDRNLTSHTYNQADADEIYKAIVEEYYEEMLSNLNNLKLKDVE
jgi:nucleotidyltransferase substrate binding protein (TIGR01987 family)